MSRAVPGTFDANAASTNGASYASKTLYLENDNKIKLNMWDTAGQERYRVLTTFFINECDSIILGYDVTVPNTFDSIKSFWYKHSKEKSEADLIYLVGNKIDLIDDRRVPKDEARQYCEENILKFPA